MRFSRSFLVLFCLVPTLPCLALAPQQERTREVLRLEPGRAEARGENLETTAASPAGDAARAYLARYGGAWKFTVDHRTSRFTMVQGSGIPLIPGGGNRLGDESLAALARPDGEITLAGLEPLVRSFLEHNAALVLPPRGELVLDPAASRIREGGRLISFHFGWTVDGIPVEGARVFVRINNGNVTQLGAPLVGPIDVDTAPVLDGAAARDALLAYSGDQETARLVHAPELILEPVDIDSIRLDYRLLWKMAYRLAGRLETWEGRVDARTGEILSFRDTNRYARVVGGVYPRTVLDGNETTVPMPSSEVLVDGTPLTTDQAGAYVYTGGETGFGLSGLFFDTNCQGCANPAQPFVLRELGGGRIDFGLGGLDEQGNGRSTPADRNSFFHLNQVRRIGLKWLPGLGFLADTHFSSFVNIQDVCNAVFTGDAVNFFRSGGGCNNTGEISDVMYHEYGHGLDSFTLDGDGATGEATADAVAIHVTHSALLGPGFHTDGSPVRDLNKNTTSKGLLTTGNIGSKCPVAGTLGPLGFEVHCEGEIYGQTTWDLAQSLVLKHGPHTGWRTSERIFFDSLPDASHYLPSSSFPVYDAYINADDDDGNLANGTPNGLQIWNAFDLHGIAGSSVTSSTGCLRPGQPVLSVTPSCDRFDLSWTSVPGVDHYAVFRSELFQDMAYFPVAELPASQTNLTDPEVAPGVPYWYVVMAVAPSGCESTVENPIAATLPDQPILSVVIAEVTDLPAGNHSGFADPGEDIDLILSLANEGNVIATGLAATLSTTTPGVTLALDESSWPDLPPGAVAESQDALRFHVDESQRTCGDVIRFQLVPDESSGCSADSSFFDVTLGERVVVASDDFETDQGWLPDGANTTATTGQWVRGNPEATDYQPGDDATPGGELCWFSASNPGGANGTDDIDDGMVTLLSPLFDLSALDAAEVSYRRWFGLSEPGTDSGDFFRVDVSDDAGASWVNLEILGPNDPAPAWIERSFRLEQLIALTNEVRFRVQAADGTADGSVVEAAFDDLSIARFLCDDTPACFSNPTFGGLAAATAGASCGEVGLSWAPATSNCVGGEISYNVYRSTLPGFLPGPANRILSGWTATSITDVLLEPGQTYSYVVRAEDSRSGEDPNLIQQSATAATGPDDAAPIFGGLASATTGVACGETELAWAAALESCNGPVAYDIYRANDPGFTPGPENLVATTFSTSFLDAALTPGGSVSYVVRARDGAGNVDANTVHQGVVAKALDLTVISTPFESDAGGWTVTPPNDATAGNWQWGNPQGTAYQSEDDATPNGVNAWITGLSPNPSNGDVDGGTTTLLSRKYSLATAVNPVVRYSRWFTNDLGGSPGDPTDDFRVDVSNNDGQSWTALEQIGAGTPLAWIPVELPLPVNPTANMRFRYSAADLGAGSLVEAGVDDFSLVDIGQGCNACGINPLNVCTIGVSRSGDDIVLSWASDPAVRVVIYRVTGCGEEIKIGTVKDATSFVHEKAALSGESFNYRVTIVNNCGIELPFCGPTNCP